MHCFLYINRNYDTVILLYRDFFKISSSNILPTSLMSCDEGMLFKQTTGISSKVGIENVEITISDCVALIFSTVKNFRSKTSIIILLLEL